jgi:two-component system CheB/CheR fusion protein
MEKSDASTEAKRPFFVGIGSSAGGLEALTLLLPGLPTGLGLRYVVVQHMSPTHRSMMVQLLGRISSMEVLDVTHGCIPEPDKVYVTPPNTNVALNEDGSLHLMEPPPETVPKPSVNVFFTSLAEVVGDRAIGVVLSGTGSDGAVGLHAIKAAGGFSFAQEPNDAKYDGMVRAAIEAGGVDWVLAAEAIGAEIMRVVERERLSEHREVGGAMVPATLQALLRTLYAHTRIDFTGYKEATLLRRVERRMTSTGCLTLDQYVDYTRANPKELHALSQDMLISVTSFFRDRMAYIGSGRSWCAPSSASRRVKTCACGWRGVPAGRRRTASPSSCTTSSRARSRGGACRSSRRTSTRPRWFARAAVCSPLCP